MKSEFELPLIFDAPESKGNGYVGKSMSVNAKNAYSIGEKPISAWKKQEIVEEISAETDVPEEILAKLTLKELRKHFLGWAGWHHTGAFYNSTQFYKLKEDLTAEIVEKTIAEAISARKAPKRKSEAERAEAKKSKDTLEEAREVYLMLHIIFESGMTKLTTEKGVIRRYLYGKMDLNSEYNKALRFIKKRDEARVNGWRKLPADHWRHESVYLYENDIEGYAKRMTSRINLVNNGDIQEIKKRLTAERKAFEKEDKA